MAAPTGFEGDSVQAFLLHAPTRATDALPFTVIPDLIRDP